MFYSQSKQDELLEKNVFKNYKHGIFVDVGANDGININNTYYFEKNHNWTGLNVEPIPETFKKLVENRPKCINLNCAVSNVDGEVDFVMNTGYTEMISGIKNNYDQRHFERLMRENQQMGSTTTIVKVPSKRLETIFDDHNIRYVNYLSIDVEGAEFDVIKSINFDKVFIDVIGFENNYEDTSVPIVKYLEDKNYTTIIKYSDILMINRDSVFFKLNVIEQEKLKEQEKETINQIQIINYKYNINEYIIFIMDTKIDKIDKKIKLLTQNL